MTSVCFIFKVHQPYRLKNYQAADINVCHCYEDEATDRESINTIADACCLPANDILYNQILRQKGKFRIGFSVSGVMLELFQRYRPDVIVSFKKLALTGCVEFLAETYYHSLSALYAGPEFQRQVMLHGEIIHKLFGQRPAIFRNTELIHDNRIAGLVGAIGLKGILCEGNEKILKGRERNQLYRSPGNEQLALLLRHPALSDDIAFRFGDPNWSEHPLTAEKFARWLHGHPASADLINLFFDYTTFGIHKKKETGILTFLEQLPGAVLNHPGFLVTTPSEALKNLLPKDVYDVPQTISWQDHNDASYRFCENVMQNNTLKKIYSIGQLVLQSPDEQDLVTWGRLQSADYFYYMTDGRDSQLTQKYLNPYHSASDVFRYYTHLVADFEISLIKKIIAWQRKKFPAKKIPFSILSN